MRSHSLTNKNIDEIGTKVLKAIRIQDQEIDRIVGADNLFGPVRAAMADRQTVAKNTLINWTSFFLWSRRNVPAAAAATVVFGAFYLIRMMPTETISYKTVPPIEYPASVADLGATDIAFTITKNKTNRLLRKPLSKQRRPLETEDVGEFQALTYTGDANDASDSQIVRVELPRSSLFAMGVDVPVENQTTNKVKADLLIGEDGVMRAVRVVNQGEIK